MNLSVASLINNTANNTKLSTTEKQAKQQVICTCSTNTQTKNTIATSLPARNVPTLAYSELLYKTISSHISSTCSISSSALGSAGIIYTHGLQNISNRTNNSTVYTSTVNPLSHIKSLTNSVIMQGTNLNVSQANSSYIHIKPAPAVLYKTANFPVGEGHIKVSRDRSIQNVSAFTKSPNSQTSSNTLITGNVVGVSNIEQKTFQAVKTGNANGPNLTLPPIFVPKGWNRILEKDGITYVSPNKSRLRHHDDLVNYLLSESTCKCGLECPLKPEEVFSFNPKVPSKFGFSANSDPNHVTACGVCKRFEECFPSASRIKHERRGRKPGKVKRGGSEDEKTVPDRKKILLTGASPLEMFQTGMDVINALSVTPFKAAGVTEKKEEATSAFSNLKVRSKSLGSPPPSLSKFRTNSVPGCDTQASIGNLNPSNTDVSSTTGKVLENSSLSKAPTVNKSVVTSSISKPSFSPLIKPNLIDMPFPKSLMGDKKRPRKPSSRGRGRGSTIRTPEEMTYSKKKTLKKVLPDAAVKKASELQLNGYMQHTGYFPAQKSMPGADAIPSLQTIQSTPVYVSNQQVMTSQAMLSTAGKTPAELKEIYLQAALINQQLQAASAYGKVTLVSPTGSTLAVDARNAVQIPMVNPTAPPNRTISSVNQLPEALRNQLNSINSQSLQLSQPSHAIVTSSHLQQEQSSALSQQQCNALLKTVLTTRKTSSESTAETSMPPLAVTGATSQQVNKPLPELSLSTTLVSSNCSQSQTPASGQQMVLVQFLTQNASNSETTTAKVNTPIVRTYSVPHPQAYVHTEAQNKILLMGKGNASQALKTLAMQKTPSTQQNPVQIDDGKRTLQIQGLIPMNAHPSQAVAVAPTMPVQYVTAVNRSGYPIAKQQLENPYPMIQYPTQPMSYMYPANAGMLRPSSSDKTGNFVRIAPAVPPPGTAKVQLFEQEKKKKEQELLESMQEQLRRDSVVSQVSPAALSGALSFITSVALAASKTNTPSTVTRTITPENDPPTSISTCDNVNPAKLQTNISTASSLPSTSSGVSVTAAVFEQASTVSSTALAPSDLKSHASLIISSCLSNKIASCPDNSLTSAEFQKSDAQKSTAPSDEVTLHCDEQSSDLLSNSDGSKQHSPKHFPDNMRPVTPVDESLRKSTSFIEGDLVWVQISGYPSWPGKVINYIDAKRSQQDGKLLYVSWFGSNQVHSVDASQLKAFDEGFKGLDCNLTKRGYRANKKQLNDLEKAIAEALEELEARTGGSS